MTSIYALVDPRDSEIRYIGKTRMGLDRRLDNHFASRKPVYSSHWVHSLKSSGYKPLIIELESSLSEKDWPEAEQFWIAYFKMLGARLTNFTKGGHHFTKIGANICKDSDCYTMPDFNRIADKLCNLQVAKRLNPKLYKIYCDAVKTSSKTDDGLFCYYKVNPLPCSSLLVETIRHGVKCFLLAKSDIYVTTMRTSTGIITRKDVHGQKAFVIASGISTRGKVK